MDVSDYVIGAVIGLSIAFIGGGIVRGCVTKPVAIYEKQIEGDQRKYLILERRGNPPVPFVKQADGSYKRLDDVQEAESEALSKKLSGDR